MFLTVALALERLFMQCVVFPLKKEGFLKVTESSYHSLVTLNKTPKLVRPIGGKTALTPSSHLSVMVLYIITLTHHSLSPRLSR